MPSELPTIEVAFVLAQDEDGYVACVRSGRDHQPIITFNLPRAVVDQTVLDAAQTKLEVRLDGTVAAYVEAGLRTLSSSRLLDLIRAAVSADALAAEDDAALVGRLEAELEQALEIVRRARA